MGSWNVIADGEDFILMNGDSTRVTVAKRTKVNIAEMLSSMETAEVPISYTRSLEEIRFTRLNVHGYYVDNVIKLSPAKSDSLFLARVFAHELAHHIDDREDVVSDEALRAEKKKKAKHISDSYASRSVDEYFAVGFEFYYFGTKEERRKLRLKNPILYNKIRNLHRKYKKL